MKPKVLVTGSAGFIAPHILEECKNKGWSSWGLDVLDPKDEDKISDIDYVKKTFLISKLQTWMVQTTSHTWHL